MLSHRRIVVMFSVVIGGFVLVSACKAPEPLGYDPNQKKCIPVNSTPQFQLNPGHGEPVVAGRTEATDTLWNSGVSQIIGSKCVGCHSGGQEPNLSGYQNSVAAAGHITEAFESDVHPSDKLNLNEKNAFQAWLLGLKSGSANPQPRVAGPITSGGNGQNYFTTNLANIVARECATCHGGDERAQPLLETYSQVKLAMGEVISAIQKTQGEKHSMPPSHQLETSKLALFTEWQRVESNQGQSGDLTKNPGTRTPQNGQGLPACK